MKNLTPIILNIHLIKKKDFWSTLNQAYAPQKEIDRTFEIIRKFNLKTSKDLTLFYSKCDVLLLADVFENFIKTSMRDYEIIPLYCYSLPGHTCKARFNYTKVKLDYIKESKLLLLLENNIRGRISSVMGDRYIKLDDNKKLLYIDANSVYGWAMSQYLPTGDFEEIDIQNEDEILNIISTADDNEIGYFIECDLQYLAGIYFFYFLPVQN